MKNNKLVSVVVPTRNSDKTLHDCLKSIEKQTYSYIEIIVIDNNSTDKTKKIAKKFTKHVFNKGPERSAQRNFGAFKSKGSFLMFIDSDMVLSPNIVKECVQKIKNNSIIQSVIIPEKSFGSGFWAECKALERSFYLNNDLIEAARFYKLDAFNKLNGFDEKNTGTEDYDLSQRLKNKFGIKAISRIKSFIFHDETGLSLWQTMKTKYYYAQKLYSYVKQKSNRKNFIKQSSIFGRYSLFFSNPRVLFKNPFIGVGMLFMKTFEFISGGIGAIVGLIKFKLVSKL